MTLNDDIFGDNSRPRRDRRGSDL